MYWKLFPKDSFFSLHYQCRKKEVFFLRYKAGAKKGRREMYLKVWRNNTQVCYPGASWLSPGQIHPTDQSQHYQQNHWTGTKPRHRPLHMNYVPVLPWFQLDNWNCGKVGRVRFKLSMHELFRRITTVWGRKKCWHARKMSFSSWTVSSVGMV